MIDRIFLASAVYRGRTRAALAAALVVIVCHGAQAQVESNFSAGGGVRIGYSTSTCNASVLGAICYNSNAGGRIDFCNGTTWANVGSAGGGGTIDALSDARTDYGIDSMFLGHEAENLTTGAYNTAFGSGALAAVTTGSDNVAIGNIALNYNDTGVYNVAIGGREALRENNDGSSNIAIGMFTLTRNTSGSKNIAIGEGALFDNEDSENIAIGNGALGSNIGGYQSTAIGHGAMSYANDTTPPFPTFNTSLGYEALRGSTTAANNTGSGNTAIGHSALLTTTSGDHNTAVGQETLYNNLSGEENVAIGFQALGLSTIGNDNTAIGHQSLNFSTGTGNTAFGWRAGSNITTGNYNIMIGTGANVPSAAGSLQLSIGDTLYGDLSTDRIGIGTNTATQTYDLTFSSSDKKVIGVDNNAGAGRDLTLRAGSATSGANNGGNLNLLAGNESTTGVAGIVDVQSGIGLSNDVTSASLGASQNNYVPTNGGRAAVYRLTASTPITITGLAGGSDGRVLTLMNVGTNAITLADENASSTAGNRLALTQNLSLAADQSTVLIYDSTSTRWRVFGADGLGGGGSAAGANTQIQFNSSGSFAGSTNLVWNGTRLAITGDIEYTGTATDVSDRRLKTDIVALSETGSMLDRIKGIDTYRFRMKNDHAGAIEFGVMAQDLKSIFPELVVTNTSTPEGYMSVNYVGLIAPMIAAMQEQQAIIDKQQAQIEHQQKQIDVLIKALPATTAQ